MEWTFKIFAGKLCCDSAENWENLNFLYNVWEHQIWFKVNQRWISTIQRWKSTASELRKLALKTDDKELIPSETVVFRF